MAAVAATGAAAIAAAAAIVPAFAATRPADHPPHAARARTAAHGKAHQHTRRSLAAVITSEFGDGGKYVTVVSCTGKITTPPPLILARRGDPLTVKGGRPTETVKKLLSEPKTYHTVYSCTVTVKEKTAKPKTPKKPRTVTKQKCEWGIGGIGGIGGGPWHLCHRVILNTGFGGAAGTVAKHHPAS
jgi:hypothetical protein